MLVLYNVWVPMILVSQLKHLITSDAGLGMFARSSSEPQTPLFTIPASALINIKTLSPHYPRKPSLNATQLISLHLAIHRPKNNQESSDHLFGPYISIMPRDFDFHPLTWLILRETGQVAPPSLDHLPPRVLEAVRLLAERFKKDWKSVRVYLVCGLYLDLVKFVAKPEFVTESQQATTADSCAGHWPLGFPLGLA
jgi:hypothetical protein